MREGPYFINVRRQAAENLFGGVYVYELDDERRLTLVGHAETAAQDASGRWVLTNYAETRLAEDSTAARTVDRLVTDARFNADFFGVAVAQPGSLPLADLYAFKQHLEKNQLDASMWDIAFWSRLLRGSSRP